MIIYIAGYGRSGSTLLDIVLTNAENSFSLGEINNIFDERKKVTDEFYAKILEETINELNLSDTTLLSIHNSSKLFYKYDPNFKLFWTVFLKKIEESEEFDFFVDSSKTTWWSLFRPYNLKKSGLDVKIIFLKASYSKVWKSALKGSNATLTNKSNSQKKHYLFAIKSFISMFLTDLLTKILYINKNYSYTILKFEDFITNPMKSIKIISDTFNIDFVNLEEKVIKNEFLVTRGYLGNRLRKNSKYISIKKNV